MRVPTRRNGPTREADDPPADGPAASATARLRGLSGVTWRWKQLAPRRARRTPPIGVIAQDVEKVFPELVSTDRSGYKQVYYTGLIAPLIEAVKELDERVAALDRRVRAIEAGDGPDD
jgi:hypothetical protein